MAFTDHVKLLLLNDISNIAKNPNSFVNNSVRNFTRKLKISLQQLIEFYICMKSRNKQQELLKYFNFRSNTSTVSAFHQQRSKLKPDVFVLGKRTFKSLYATHLCNDDRVASLQ